MLEIYWFFDSSNELKIVFFSLSLSRRTTFLYIPYEFHPTIMKIVCIIAYDTSFVGQTIDILRDVESIQEYSLLMTRCVVKKKKKKKKKRNILLCISTIHIYIYIYEEFVFFFFNVNLLRNTHSFLYHSQQQQEQLRDCSFYSSLCWNHLSWCNRLRNLYWKKCWAKIQRGQVFCILGRKSRELKLLLRFDESHMPINVRGSSKEKR